MAGALCYYKCMRSRHFIFFIIALAILLPQAVFARPIWYGDIVRIDGDTAYVIWQNLEVKNYFSCSVATLLCEGISQVPNAPNAPDASASVAPQNTQVAFPRKASYQRLSHSGRFGAYMLADKNANLRTIGLIDEKTGSSYKVNDSLNFWNLLEDQPRIFRFSPDDATLAYVDDRSGFMSLYIVPLKNLSSAHLHGTAITSGVSVGDFLYADENTILYVANSKENPYDWMLYSYDMGTKTKKVLAENLAYDTTLRQSGTAVLFNQMTPEGTIPALIPNALSDTSIKHFQIPLASPAYSDSISYSYLKLAGVDAVFMKNTPTVPLAPPATAGGASPLIIWLHGGPYRQASFYRHTYLSYGEYDWMLEEAVSAGAEVLKLDYAGSYGGGRKHTEAIKGGVGTADIADVANAVDAFEKKHSVGNVYLVGNSYGGYLALRSLVGYPAHFAGAFSINGVTDWAALNTYLQTSIFNEYFSGVPSRRNKALYDKASIFNRLSRLTSQKIFVAQSEKDATVPPVQASLLKDEADAHKLQATFISIPGEDHVFVKNQSMDTLCQNLFEMAGLDAGGKCALESEQ